MAPFVTRAAARTEAVFDQFVSDTEPRVRRALVATYGAAVGREAAVDAFAYAWEHWARLSAMDNPAGYLYRVGQTAARRALARTVVEIPIVPVAHHDEPSIEPALPAALRELSEQQRVVVVLVHGYGWSQRDAAELLGISASTLRNHLARGMHHLRDALGGTS